MSSRPPAPKSMDDFIAAAEKPVVKKDDLPWLQPGVRENQPRPITIGLKEPYLLKLRYLSKTLKQGTQQEIVRNILEKNLDDMLEQLL